MARVKQMGGQIPYKKSKYSGALSPEELASKRTEKGKTAAVSLRCAGGRFGKKGEPALRASKRAKKKFEYANHKEKKANGILSGKGGGAPKEYDIFKNRKNDEKKKLPGWGGGKRRFSSGEKRKVRRGYGALSLFMLLSAGRGAKLRRACKKCLKKSRVKGGLRRWLGVAQGELAGSKEKLRRKLLGCSVATWGSERRGSPGDSGGGFTKDRKPKSWLNPSLATCWKDERGEGCSGVNAHRQRKKPTRGGGVAR